MKLKKAFLFLIIMFGFAILPLSGFGGIATAFGAEEVAEEVAADVVCEKTDMRVFKSALSGRYVDENDSEYYFEVSGDHAVLSHALSEFEWEQDADDTWEMELDSEDGITWIWFSSWSGPEYKALYFYSAQAVGFDSFVMQEFKAAPQDRRVFKKAPDEGPEISLEGRMQFDASAFGSGKQVSMAANRVFPQMGETLYKLEIEEVIGDEVAGYRDKNGVPYAGFEYKGFWFEYQLRAPSYDLRPETLVSVTPPTEQDLAGNANSWGYIAEHNGVFYFANRDDQGKLYQMDGDSGNKTKLSDRPNGDYRAKIQYYDNQIFYLLAEQAEETIREDGWLIDFQNSLYSFDLKNKTEKPLTDKNIYSYDIHNGWIYFSTVDTYELYKMRTDGSAQQLLAERWTPIYYVQYANNEIYFLYFEELMATISLNGAKENIYYLVHSTILPQFVVYNDQIYYVDPFIYMDGSGELPTAVLCRTTINEEDASVGMESEDPDASFGGLTERVPILIDVAFFTIFQNQIYYSTYDGKIYKTDIDGHNQKYIADGQAPIVFANDIFYLDSNSSWEMLRIPK